MRSARTHSALRSGAKYAESVCTKPPPPALRKVVIYLTIWRFYDELALLQARYREARQRY